MLPCNVEEFHVCSDHSGLIYPSRFKNCCLCKAFGRTKCSKSGLRMITKLYAFAAWKKSKIRLSFGRKMCTQCRNELEKSYMTDEIKDEYDANFQWLYDINLSHTPSISSSDSDHVLSQSFNDLIIGERREHLKQFLKGSVDKIIRTYQINIIFYCL